MSVFTFSTIVTSIILAILILLEVICYKKDLIFDMDEGDYGAYAIIIDFVLSIALFIIIFYISDNNLNKYGESSYIYNEGQCKDYKNLKIIDDSNLEITFEDGSITNEYFHISTKNNIDDLWKDDDHIQIKKQASNEEIGFYSNIKKTIKYKFFVKINNYNNVLIVDEDTYEKFVNVETIYNEE